MTELLTAAQMRAIEAAAIASGAVTGLELMERAGQGVVQAVFEEWPDLRAGLFRAVVLCGPGNNGGDGFVVARLLKEWGWEVEVYLYGTPERMPPDARVNHDRWVAMGEVKLISLETVAIGRVPDLCVDALFGTGLVRPIASALVDVITAFADGFLGSARVVSVDICSGRCADSGVLLGRNDDCLTEVLRPDLTVTFHRPKLGHFLAGGARRSGVLKCVDIGLAGASGAVRLTTRPLAMLAKATGHKFSYGHALILSGLPGHGGAARMTARGALRIGAGLVTVACLPEAVPENAARLDAIMLRPVADGAGLAAVLADDRINALCIGPGLGLDARAAELVKVALTPPSPSHPSPTGEGRHQIRRAVVLDADALTLLARDAGLFAMLHNRCVLTPHGGEFARLFADIAAKLQAPAVTGPAYSRVDATREAAARAGCVVLFKGPDTVIASPDGTCAINSAAYDRVAPWLATAGSGDVLAGFITGLLARGFAPQFAAETAAWLHVECARNFGPGLIAEDLPEELPKVLRAMGL